MQPTTFAGMSLLFLQRFAAVGKENADRALVGGASFAHYIALGFKAFQYGSHYSPLKKLLFAEILAVISFSPSSKSIPGGIYQPAYIARRYLMLIYSKESIDQLFGGGHACFRLHFDSTLQPPATRIKNCVIIHIGTQVLI